MPIYGYRCRNCGHEFEILQKMSDAPPKACPKCSGELQKILYPAGVIFKGSGFYSTDYKSGSKGSSSSSSSSNGSETGSDKKSDAKPASESSSEAKTESKPAKSDSDS